MLGTGNALGQTALYAGRRFAPRPLDAFAADLELGFGLSRLVSTYQGPCRRVLRSSDSTEADFGFLPDGSYDLASEQAFVGAGTGTVTRWYDQSGNGFNGTQATAANRPRTINAGTPDLGPDGAPVLYLDGTDRLSIAGAVNVARAADNLTIGLIGKSDSTVTAGLLSFGRNASTGWNRVSLQHTPTTGGTVRLTASAADADNPPAVTHAYTAGTWARLIGRARFLDGAIDIAVNGNVATAALPTTTPSLDSASFAVMLGSLPNEANPMVGTLRAVVVLRAAPSIAALDAALAKLG